MTNKSTKRALLSSAMALFLCFAMLLGTTFAWFTDSVESGTNQIVAGNLDIELEYATVTNGTVSAWNKVAGADNIFDSDARWEPGRVEVVYLKVSNLGSLDLKYQLGVNVTADNPGTNVNGDEFYLSEYLVFKTVLLNDETEIGTYTRDNAVDANDAIGFKDYNGKTTALESGKFDYVALIVYMPTTVGNAANYMTGTTPPSIEFGINLYATQQGAESDSFGDDYDDGANHENFKVTTGQDLQNAVNDANPGDTITIENDIDLTEGLVIPAVATGFAMRSTPAPITIDLNGKTLTITAAYDDANAMASSAIVNNGSVILTGEGTIKATNNYTVRNYGTMVIDGVTIENGVMNFADLTVEKGNISNSRTGKHTIYGNNATLTINGGTFFNGNPGNATIFSYAGEVVINGGEFSIADGKETLGWTSCLLDAQGNAKFTINGGTVNGEIRDYNKNTTVYGGTFAQNPSAYVPTGYTVVTKADGSFAVVKGDVVANDNASLNDQLTAGKTNIALGAGNYSMPTTSGDITITGTLDTVITIDKPTANKVTLNGVTVVGSGDYTGIQHSDTVVYENCLVKGVQFLYANKVVFKNCTVDLTETASYIWTYGAKNVEFIDCEFNTKGKAILIYSEDANLVTNVTVTGCTFNATESALASGNVAAAIEIDSSLSTNGRYTLTTANNTVDPDFSGEWRTKKTAANGNATVNGVDYVAIAIDGVYPATPANVQEVIDKAIGTPTILLNAGKYTGMINMKSGVTLLGTEGAVVDCVNLNGADNVTLKNIEFDAAGAQIAYDGKGNTRFAANILSGAANKNGKGTRGLVIDGCVFKGAYANGGTTIAFNDQGRGSGQSGDITITGCTFATTGGYVDIYTYYAGYGKFVIENNTFASEVVDRPIYLGRYQSSTPVVVKGNTFTKVATFADATLIQPHSGAYTVSFDAADNTFAN